MSIAIGPNQVNSGITFSVDMTNTRSNAGAPTTNVLPGPQYNGRFTTDNQWGTYNTNQYNNNTYFSIGTISSVSGNVVTTSSGHPLRTYDVITPQTTGGGVTAGTNYFVKVISSTQFSLHAYNSSQDGSQGYINSATGNFKVYDSIALNQQISINATSFPTMWWGPPHLPNSGLVKEIVVGGGYVPGTNCMRFHIPRANADGMAYGVYVPVTAGDVIAVSYWVRASDSRADGQSLGYSTYFGANSAFSGSTVLTQTWQKVVFTWTASATFSFYQYWWPPSVVCDIDMADLQVELNTGGIASPFTIGTRPNTQSVIDVAGNNVVTNAGLTYSNAGTYTFNGTSNYLSLPNTQLVGASAGTVTAIIKIPSAESDYNCIFSCETGPDWNNLRTWLSMYGANQIRLTVANGASSTQNGCVTSALSYNTTYHITGTYDGTNLIIYVNGVANVTYASNIVPGTFTPTLVRIGHHYSTRYFNGTIYALNTYSRALSAAEVLQNYNSAVGRYGL